jgi:heat shock protein HtpX
VSVSNLFEQQESNKRRSTWLTIGFVLFFAWIGFGGDLAIYLSTRDAVEGGYRHVVPVIGIVTTLFAAGVAWFAWRFGPGQILKSTGARELTEPSTPGEQRLANVVDEMAIASGLPRPKVWIIPDPDPNAFATGRDPATANLAVTEGLLAALDRDELQGVVAHEMAHIKNFDVRLMTLLAGMVGAIALLSDSLRGFLRFGGRIGGSRQGKKDSGNPLAVIVLVLWIITLILAPFISRLLAMAVSRKREFLADATGAQFTRNPMALARALEKVDGAPAATRSISQGAAHLCIVDPGERHWSEREGWVGDVFSSHPPIAQRIARLKGMAYQPASLAGTA